jgi:hypothetical protein
MFLKFICLALLLANTHSVLGAAVPPSTELQNVSPAELENRRSDITGGPLETRAAVSFPEFSF